jgi:hypothetical protein
MYNQPNQYVDFPSFRTTQVTATANLLLHTALPMETTPIQIPIISPTSQDTTNTDNSQAWAMGREQASKIAVPYSQPAVVPAACSKPAASTEIACLCLYLIAYTTGFQSENLLSKINLFASIRISIEVVIDLG